MQTNYTLTLTRFRNIKSIAECLDDKLINAAKSSSKMDPSPQDNNPNQIQPPPLSSSSSDGLTDAARDIRTLEIWPQVPTACQGMNSQCCFEYSKM